MITSDGPDNDYDRHVRAGHHIGGDHFVFLEYVTPDGEMIAYGAGKDAPAGSIMVGLIEHHRDSAGEWCGGWVGFKNVEIPAEQGEKWGSYLKERALHELVAECPLETSPSLLCRQKECSSHGYIRNGLWQEC